MENLNTGKFRKKRNRFAQVSNHCLHNMNLSYRAKGLYATIQSFIDIPNFDLYKSNLQGYSTEGRDAFNRSWKELVDAGYLKIYKINTHEGFIYEYELLDEPDISNPTPNNTNKNTTKSKKQNKSTSLDAASETISPDTGFQYMGPDTDSPGVGNPYLNNNTYNKNTYNNNNIVSNNAANNNTVVDVVTDILNPSKTLEEIYPAYAEIKDLVKENNLTAIDENLEKGEMLLKYLTSVAKDRNLQKITNLLNDITLEKPTFDKTAFLYESSAYDELCKYPLTIIILELASSYINATANVEGYALTILKSLADKWALDKNFLKNVVSFKVERIEFKAYEPGDIKPQIIDKNAIETELNQILSQKS